MFEKRLAAYRAIGYARGEAPLGVVEPHEETTIEYDEDTDVQLRYPQISRGQDPFGKPD